MPKFLATAWLGPACAATLLLAACDNTPMARVAGAGSATGATPTTTPDAGDVGAGSPLGGTATPTSGAAASPAPTSGGGSGSPAPASGTTPAPSSGGMPAPGSTPSSGTGTGTSPPAPVPADYPGVTNTVPPPLAAGVSRAGTAYNIYIQGPKTGDKIAFTVFEPTTLTGGQTYPLVMNGHGFGGSRDTPGSSGQLGYLLKQGYGGISIDQRGHGESGGTIRVMDPDAEGQDVLAVLDWCEARLGWLRYGVSVDGTDPHNLVLGGMGGSYGGMNQYMVHNIDPRRRLDAITPEIAPNDLNFALFPGTVAKTIWDVALFGDGEAIAGAQGSQTVGHFDPYIADNYPTGLVNAIESPGFRDFFYYHSNAYFCGSGQTVATNGGDGTKPGLPPTTGTKIHAMLYQGVRDTLFNLSDGIANYECLAKQGGDVRFLSYTVGHNSLAPVVPDPGLVYIGGEQALDNKCGSLTVDAARLAFFEQYLKGIPNAAASVPTRPCLTTAPDKAVLVNHLLHAAGPEGTPVAIPATSVVLGASDAPIAVPLGITGATGGTLVAGIPHLKVTLSQLAPVPGSPTVFVGLGQTHNGTPGAYDLIDNMVLPLTGAGDHDVDLIAVAAMLNPGEQLVLLVYGLQDQFQTTGATASQVAVQPVSVSGTVRLPLPAAGTYSAAP